MSRRHLGSMTVDALGEARLNLNTEMGARVPTIQKGSAVRVQTAGGALVVSGKF